MRSTLQRPLHMRYTTHSRGLIFGVHRTFSFVKLGLSAATTGPQRRQSTHPAAAITRGLDSHAHCVADVEGCVPPAGRDVQGLPRPLQHLERCCAAAPVPVQSGLCRKHRTLRRPQEPPLSVGSSQKHRRAKTTADTQRVIQAGGSCDGVERGKLPTPPPNWQDASRLRWSSGQQRC